MKMTAVFKKTNRKEGEVSQATQSKEKEKKGSSS